MRKNIKWIANLAIASSLLLTVIGCSAGTAKQTTADSTSTSASTASSAPKTGGTLNISLQADPVTLDPSASAVFYERQIYQSIYDKLVDLDASGNIVPMLAEKWSVSGDKKTYTLNLRQGVKFQDGTDFNAEAVKFNFERNKQDTSPRKNELKFVNKVTVVDTNTVQIELTQPFSAFLSILTDRSGMMVSPDAVKKYGKDFTSNPVGTGPFKFSKYTRGSSLILEKNPNYWQQGLPKLDQVVFKIFPDPNVAFINLKSGAVDMTDSFPFKEIANMKSDPKSLVINEAGQGFVGFHMNLNKAPFDKVELRQAVDLLIDRDAIVNVVLNGAAIPAHSPFVPSHFAYGASDKAAKPDLAKAKELLNKAGVPNGFSFTLQYIQNQTFQQVVQMIQGMLKPAGINVTLEALDATANQDHLVKTNFEAILATWSGRPDPDQNAYDYNITGGFLNYSKYSNPEVDKLLNASRTEDDLAKRKVIYENVMKTINTDIPYVFLYHPNYVFGLSKAVQGYKYVPDGMIRTVNMSKN
ncbi:ABC transporter substrate-binding protein [Paenibacillus sp. GP183]|jgi:peptide/nickel transport system substrate-binding protein|uniref:ABC transporter substrate-binding protein n=1 Tax=Paenibacillus sp. GP183 TaxID=1882751 RepID=UPI00089A254C|nr:ABC transporter substrate-binding protein [Paenibacillus sp. GP183]SEB73525.1 peptide/nickel transport system substrate-binding protein [Paenibacillus sp. GP183]